MLAVHLVTARLLAAAWTAPEVSEEEGSYASRFYRWFSESSKSCLLFLVAPPGLIDTLAQLLAWRSLLWLSMIWWWMYLTQSDFLSTTSLAWSLALHLLFCFSQEKPLRWKEIKTHTQQAATHTRIANGNATGEVRHILLKGKYLHKNFIKLWIRNLSTAFFFFDSSHKMFHSINHVTYLTRFVQSPVKHLRWGFLRNYFCR